MVVNHILYQTTTCHYVYILEEKNVETLHTYSFRQHFVLFNIIVVAVDKQDRCFFCDTQTRG